MPTSRQNRLARGSSSVCPSDREVSTAASPVDDTAKPADLVLHASAVAIDGRGALITGPSGAGKSALALQLMALGATLVADDGVLLRRRGDALVALAPASIRGLIEARGIGLLPAQTLESAPLSLVIDLAKTEIRRLPPARTICLLGMTLPLLHKVESAHFPAAVVVYLRGVGST